MTESDAEAYRRFARDQAHGSSPSFERWALAVADSPDVLDRLASLPAHKRQPNLVFAAVRWHGGSPGDIDSLRSQFADNWAAVQQTIMARSTQTNEPARCAVLLPLLNHIDGPIALVELGAAAGLCLLPDRYSYRYNGQPSIGRSTLTLKTAVHGELPAELTLPKIAWRIGVDLNPLDPADSDTRAWLTNLVWPEHEHRRTRLRAALDLAGAEPPMIRRADLIEAIPELVDAAAPHGTPVVMHCATFAYLDADARGVAADAIARSGARWISFEGRDVTPGVATPDIARTVDTLFVAALDGQPWSVANGHGDTFTMLDRST